jgi:hypothetical protein
MNNKLAALAKVYVYAAVSAAAALWTAGEHDWKAIGTAALGALLGPIAQFANPADASVGVGSAAAAPVVE